MSRALTAPFVACLILGLLPIGFVWLPDDVRSLTSGPWFHFGCSAVALTIYAIVVYRTLAGRTSQVTDPGNEASDSVYFLGFLQTMGVLAGAFLPGGDQRPDTLFLAVGTGVLLTLYGLAIRVAFTLYFESEADVIGARQRTSATPPATPAGHGAVLSSAQMDQISTSVTQLSDITVAMAKRVESLVHTMDRPIDELIRTADRMITEVRHGNDAITSAATEMQTTLRDALTQTSNLFTGSATRFQENVSQSETALRAVLGEWESFHRTISQNLKSTVTMTSQLERLATQQLQGFAQVVQRIVLLSRQVEESVDAIPNPTTALTQSLQQLTSSAATLVQYLDATRQAAGASAEHLQRVSETAQKVAPALAQVPPSVQAAAAHLQDELRAINTLLDEFANLSKRRIEGSGR